jgi:hypothetical protein
LGVPITASYCPQRQEDQWDRDIRIRERAVQLALELERQQHRGKDTDANEEGIYARVPVSEGIEKLVGNQADSLAVFAVLPVRGAAVKTCLANWSNVPVGTF